ncbi:MAG: TetR family transcriptional regulator [Paramuribaculum sp.]|nr:TetR family transcriptional regulator [Paramuribaculum sp.]
MVSKTRDKLIEVARQLFAHKGIENTTMNDIAAASDKGRRTIYTYFKNKRDIFNAVIERESEQLISRLRVIKEADMPPVEKLTDYLRVRFDFLMEAVPRHDGLLQILGRDFRKMDRIRRLALVKEMDMFKNVIAEGVETGEFDPAQAARLPYVESMVFQGIDYCNLRGFFQEHDISVTAIRDDVIRFMIKGLLIAPAPNNLETTN